MPVGKMSENTCNAILTEQLNKNGINAFFERHVPTLEGIKKPDVFIQADGGYYFVEGKQRPQAQLIHAVSKAHIYKESIKSNVTAKGVFAVLYSEDCSGPCEAAVLLDKAPYYIEQRTKSVEELSTWIKSFIEKPAPPAEINTGHAIRLLHQAVDAIHYAFTKLDIAEIDEIFGGKTFFESVLGYEEEDNVPKQHLRMAAAYLLVNQIMFYEVLARETKEYEALDSEKIQKPSELRTIYFAKVLLKDYKPIFDFDIVSKLKGDEALDAVRTTINAINALTPEKHGHDILGKIFHNLIPFEIRKSVAAFFTNSEAAEFLASLAIHESDEKVIDPASGSGTLLVASYRRKKHLIEEEKGKKFALTDHKRFLEKEITGVDIMPFSAHLAAVHLALQAPLYVTDKVRIAINDSTTLEPGKTVEAAQETLKEAYKTARITDYFDGKKKDDIRRKTIKGTVTLTDKSSKPLFLDKVDVAIMNPPFTRSERLPDEYKNLLMERFADYKDLIFGKVGLHLFFIFLGDKFLKKGGRLALVLPATVLRVDSMKGVRKLLLNNYHIQYIISSFQRSAFSEAARFREVLIVATKRNEVKEDSIPDKKLTTSIVMLKTLPRNLSEARSYSEKIKRICKGLSSGQEYDDETFYVSPVSQSELQKNVDNIFSMISVSDPLLGDLWKKFVAKASDRLIKCDEYLEKSKADINIAAFDSEFNFEKTFRFITQPNRAVKNKDVWIIKESARQNKSRIIAKNRFAGIEVDIPTRALVEGFRRPSGTERINISNELDYMIVDRFHRFEDVIGDKSKAEKVVRSASTWIGSVKQGRNIIARKFNISAPGTKVICFYSDTATFGIDVWNVSGLNEDDAKIFALWFNSTPCLLQLFMGRTETEGPWMKLNQSQIINSLMPDITELSQAEKKSLVELFDSISMEELPSITEQLRTRNRTRLAIDKGILKLMGYSVTEIETILDKLYTGLGDEIQKLKGMVQRNN